MSKTRIQLSDHFTYKRLLRFVLPSIIMMIFTSVYGVVDGLFVSNFAGKAAFAAVNLIMPVPILLGALGFMLGTGGSAIVAKTLGEGKRQLANQYFSMLVLVAFVGAAVLAVTGTVLIRPLALLLGADGEMLGHCVTYGRIILISLPFFALQNIFQSFLVTAERPSLGLKITIAAGVTNMVLDLLFVGVLDLGVAGAAAATVISETVGGCVPLVYFLRPNSSLLRLERPQIAWRILGHACANGSSELMTNVSMSVVNMLYNIQLMRFAGENGVAAYGTIMYVNFFFVAAFIGYSIGMASVVGFNHGARNHMELRNVFRKSLRLILIAGAAMTVLGLLLSGVLAKIFVGYDGELLELTRRGFRIYCSSFLIMGFNIFGSAFFTALGSGLISALISFLRTLVFQVMAVLLLPLLLGIDGIWLAILMAEILALAVTGSFLIGKRKKYNY
ncbi:MAG: MATE family efflux transporter [Eubacterium sp.]|nr:MATE family efflux transporter [Eubacterium sp.]